MRGAGIVDALAAHLAHPEQQQAGARIFGLEGGESVGEGGGRGHVKTTPGLRNQSFVSAIASQSQ
jgi:hypothetical protein